MHDFVGLWCGKIKGAFEAHRWPSVKNLIIEMQFRIFSSVSLIFKFLRSFSTSFKNAKDSKKLGNYKRLVSHKINDREKRYSPWPLVFLKAQVELNRYVRNFWHHKMVHLITHFACDPACFPLPEEISESKKLPRFMKPWFDSRQKVIKRMVRKYLPDIRFAVDCFTFFTAVVMWLGTRRKLILFPYEWWRWSLL